MWLKKRNMPESSKEIKTTVVNILKHPKDFDVYIGRAGLGFDGFFGNKYRVPYDGSREECVEKFRKYFNKRIESDPEFRKRVLELKGKRLGCFCNPKICHGDVYVNYLDTHDSTGKLIPRSK